MNQKQGPYQAGSRQLKFHLQKENKWMACNKVEDYVVYTQEKNLFVKMSLDGWSAIEKLFVPVPLCHWQSDHKSRANICKKKFADMFI